MNPVRPRLSLIGCVSNWGDIFLSGCQANTDADIMMMFFNQLVQHLEMTEPNFRQTHCWIIDSAGYHTSAAMMKFYKENDLPIMFLGPYQFLMASAELLWGWIKAVDINPEQIKTGKSKLGLLNIILIVQSNLVTLFSWL